ncbi:MAG: hypothetical protein FWE61_11450, partial [Micrococcales bacterium]|nr:hypothetical protein [Micrococcales bacterium]
GFSLPPEMLAGHQAVGRYTDAWYLGCLLVWVFTGNAPGLQHGPDLLPPGLLGGPAGAALGTVVRSLCSPDPQRRMALLEAAQHLDRLRLAAPTDWVSVPATTVSAPVRDVPHATSPWNTFWLPVGLALGFLGVLGAGVGVWQATHRAPQAEHTVQTTAGSCWDDLAAGRCPDVDPVDLGGAFPVRPEVVPPYCGEEDIDAAPGGPTSTWLVHCSWSGETSDQASDVSMQWFRDAEAVAEHYRFHGMLADGVDVPVFDDGPDGPVYSATVDDQIAVAYCYAELPVCLEIQGDPQVVARTVTRFISLTSREAARLAQSYDR